MTQRKFAQHVDQLVTAKLTPDAALSDQSDRWWAEIESRRCVAVCVACCRVWRARCCSDGTPAPHTTVHTRTTAMTAVRGNGKPRPCAA